MRASLAALLLVGAQTASAMTVGEWVACIDNQESKSQWFCKGMAYGLMIGYRQGAVETTVSMIALDTGQDRSLIVNDSQEVVRMAGLASEVCMRPGEVKESILMDVRDVLRKVPSHLNFNSALVDLMKAKFSCGR